MNSQAFLDTNVLIYAFAENDSRLESAEKLVNAGGVVSVQILNEFANTLHRKFRFAWPRIHRIIDAILNTCPNPLPLSIDTHRKALLICERYRYSFYDGLILTSALEAGCRVLYTEDLQHGQVIEGLRIVNPFV
jgi:predicted nucleic acid-binding protein